MMMMMSSITLHDAEAETAYKGPAAEALHFMLFYVSVWWEKGGCDRWGTALK